MFLLMVLPLWFLVKAIVESLAKQSVLLAITLGSTSKISNCKLFLAFHNCHMPHAKMVFRGMFQVWCKRWSLRLDSIQEIDEWPGGSISRPPNFGCIITRFKKNMFGSTVFNLEHLLQNGLVEMFIVVLLPPLIFPIFNNWSKKITLLLIFCHRNYYHCFVNSIHLFVQNKSLVWYFVFLY